MNDGPPPGRFGPGPAPAAITAQRRQVWERGGYRPIPILNAVIGKEGTGKVPLGREWQLGCCEDPPRIFTDATLNTDAAVNTGLWCDGLRAIDADVDNYKDAAALEAKAIAKFGPTICRRRADSARFLLLYRAEAPDLPKKSAIGSNNRRVEALGRGQQFVAFGRHWQGATLTWSPAGPDETPIASLPVIKESDLDAFLADLEPLIGPPPPRKANGSTAEPPARPARAPGDAMQHRFERRRETAMAAISRLVDGEKHDGLLRQANVLGGYAGDAGWSDNELWTDARAALPASVKDWIAAERTFRDGLKNGRASPLVLEDRERLHQGNGAAPPPPRPPNDRWDFSPPPGEPTLPVVTVYQGKRHYAATEGISAMVTADTSIFQRDTQLVRCVLIKAITCEGKVINVPGITKVTLPMLARELGRAAEWQRVNAKGERTRIDPPKEVVEQIANMHGFWPFSPLAGVISTQTLRPDGSLLDQPGYDAVTGLMLMDPPKIPAIHDRPTKTQALEALALLNELLAEFPFTDNIARSVAMSMLLTPVLRGALPPAVPLHIVTAPAPGTGKSYLLDTAAAIATGERCPVFAVAPKEEETEKRLVGAALAGFPIIALDNVSSILTGDFLAQVSERPILTLRPLGGSALIRVSNSFTVFANGNNIAATADLVRRTVRCSLDSDLENPEDREFHADPVALVLADRGKYVAACLTVARAYIAAGLPNKCSHLPSYPQWSDIVRSALVWLGWPDPVDSMELARTDDPSRLSRAMLFTAWDEEWPDRNPNGVTTAELIAAATEFERPGFSDERRRPDLHEACLAIAREHRSSTISAERLGKWLRSAVDARVGNLKLVVNRSDKKRPRWQLIGGTGASGGYSRS